MQKLVLASGVTIFSNSRVGKRLCFFHPNKDKINLISSTISMTKISLIIFFSPHKIITDGLDGYEV